jgi:hypothetical protein
MTKRVRLIYGDGSELSKLDHVRDAQDRVFAVIGPFKRHTDKPKLQKWLEDACRKFNKRAKP